MELGMEIIEKIDKYRQERGWSINYLAMEALLTQSTVNNLYRRHTEPKISTLKSICDAFGITLAEFFTDGSEEDEEDAEIRRRIKSMSPKQKQALLLLLRSIKSE
jgi:transcriptional regulator with XRE-family HTH domain